MKIRIRDDLIVEVIDILGLNDNDWEECVLRIVGSCHNIKTGSWIFYDGVSSAFYNTDYKDIIIENNITLDFIGLLFFD